jgi:catechol 2,3-dioxygenase-like lactoylglutathione lyase family enzyme
MSDMELRFLIVKVKDLKRARDFYIRLTGEKPIRDEGKRMVEFRFGSVILGLYSPSADGLPLRDSDFGSNCIPAFGVEDLESELERVSGFAEIVSHERKGGHEWFEFRDSEGNVLEIHRK